MSKIHQPCPDCESSDALQINDDYTYCHSCKKHSSIEKYYEKIGEDVPDVTFKQQRSTESVQRGLPGLAKIKELLTTEEYKSLPERGLTAATMKAYKVLNYNGNFFFPYFGLDNTIPAAIKIRCPDKKYPIKGDFKDCRLFGQQLFSKGGKYILITEGEFDALAAYQMQGSKWPVVSLRNGAANALKDCRANYEFLDSYDTVVIDFDSDEPGQRAAREVAELFGGKSKLVRHRDGFKDACDYAAAGKGKQYTDDFWNADKYVPDGIVSGKDLWDMVNEPIKPAELQYPFDGVNTLTYGIRLGELLMVCAGSGVGKSQFIKEIVYKALQDTDDNIGLLMLEESNKKTGLGLMSLAANKPLHLPKSNSTEEERKQAFDDTLGTGRVFMFNHFGSNSIDNLVSRVRYMAKGLQCKYIVLDHISIVVSDQENLDERKALDEITTKLRTLVEETGIALICVTHLKRPEGKGHEEGAATSMSQLRGSAALGHLSDIVIGLERNSQAEDDQEKNTTIPRVLKNRFSGDVGKAKPILFDKDTCRMKEINLPEMEEAL